MKAPHRRDVADDEPGMTSMIDVVFLLLVFFVWTSSFDQPERELASQIAMPESAIEAVDAEGQSSPLKSRPDDLAPRREEVVVRIFASNSAIAYQLGAVKVADIDDLLPKLQRIAGLPTDTLLIVDPDDGVEFSDCVEIYDHALRLGFPRVLFAVDDRE